VILRSTMGAGGDVPRVWLYTSMMAFQNRLAAQRVGPSSVELTTLYVQSTRTEMLW
jgi:hypothetical protein